MRRDRGTRITGGALRGRRLEVPAGLAVRPMRSRIRQALFQRLGDITGLRVLDVFSGSGAIAIEALSRGAAHATLVEKSPVVLETLARNLEALGLRARSTVARLDPYQDRIPDHPFDVIVLDPPFPHYDDRRHDPWALAIRLGAELLDDGGVLCLEYPSAWSPPAIPSGWIPLPPRSYGETTVGIWRVHRARLG